MNKKKAVVQRYEAEALKYEFMRFGSPGGKLLEKTQRKIVRELVIPIPRKKILDVATGTGRFAVELGRCGAKVTACDLSNKMLNLGKKRARENNLNIKFEIGDAENLPYPDNTFDIVVGIRIIMHLQNYKRGLEEMKRVVKNEGYVIFEIPNRISFWAQLNKIFKIRRVEIDKSCSMHSPRSFSYSEIDKVLKTSGLKIIDVRGFLWVPETIYRISPRVLVPLIKTIENFAEKLLPIEFAENIFIKAKKLKN